MRRLNIHLADTLDRERFKRITRRDDLPRVLAGIRCRRCCTAGFKTIKLNIVAVRNLVEPDIVPMARFCRERGFEPRFIEFMPLDSQHIWERHKVLLASDIISLISNAKSDLVEPVPDADPRAPATRKYRYTDGGGHLGFIASVSKPFCLNCNRIRLTSDGKLRYCLFAIDETDVKQLLRSHATDEEIQAVIRQNVSEKWLGHEINLRKIRCPAQADVFIGG